MADAQSPKPKAQSPKPKAQSLDLTGGIMKRLTIVCLLGACVMAAATLAAQEKKYGNGVSLTTATTVERLLASPDQYLGKTVRVDGVVTAVCDMAGCWMELADQKADPKTAKSLRFKVDDGVIVFPVEAKGKRASAEGVFEKVGEAMAKEYAADQERSKGGDTTNAVPAFQVKATGAVIY
jgi:hypothetical protein